VAFEKIAFAGGFPRAQDNLAHPHYEVAFLRLLEENGSERGPSMRDHWARHLFEILLKG